MYFVCACSVLTKMHFLQAEKTTQSALPLNRQDQENSKDDEAQDFDVVELEKKW